MIHKNRVPINLERRSIAASFTENPDTKGSDLNTPSYTEKRQPLLDLATERKTCRAEMVGSKKAGNNGAQVQSLEILERKLRRKSFFEHVCRSQASFAEKLSLTQSLDQSSSSEPRIKAQHRPEDPIQTPGPKSMRNINFLESLPRSPVSFSPLSTDRCAAAQVKSRVRFTDLEIKKKSIVRKKTSKMEFMPLVDYSKVKKSSDWSALDAILLCPVTDPGIVLRTTELDRLYLKFCEEEEDAGFKRGQL